MRLPSRLSIWDTNNGREVRGVDVPEKGGVSLSWLKDGRCLAILSFGVNGRVVGDFADENTPLPPVVPVHQSSGFGFATSEQDDEWDVCYAIAPEGQRLAIGCCGLKDDRERPISLRELAVGRRIKDFKPSRQLGRQQGNCTWLHFTPDGRSLLALSGSRQAREDILVVWDAASGAKRRQMTVLSPLQQNGIKVCAVAPDSKTLALGLPDGTARLWDLTTGRETRSLTVTTAKPETYQNGVSAVAFSPDGKFLLTGGRDHVVRVWETASGREVHALRGHHSWVEALAVSPDGKRIASGASDGQIRIWDAATGADACPLEGHQYVLWSVAISPDGRHAVTDAGDGTVRAWNVNTGRPAWCRDLGERLRGPFVFTPDGKQLLGRSGSRVRLLDAATGADVMPPGEMADHPGGRVCFTPDGQTLVSVHEGEASVWEWPAGRLVRRFPLRPDVPASSKRYCNRVAFSPNSRQMLALCAFDANRGGPPLVELYDLKGGQRPRSLGLSASRICDAAFTADGTGVLLAGASGVRAPEKGDADRLARALRLVDARTGETRRRFAAPAKETAGEERVAFALACSVDGRSVASAERDGLVLLFEVATGLPRRRLVGHRGQVMSLTFTPDGKRLVTGGLDSTGLVWDVSLAALAPHSKMTADQLWGDLGSLEARRANRALAGLAAAPESAVSLLAERLRPAKGASTAAINRLVADLDSDLFEVRQKAFAQLDQLGEDIVPALRERIDKGESVEVRRRIELLLEKHDRGSVNPEWVRLLRALEVLEQIGTPQARRVLAGLAKGAEESRLTREAKACLARLAGLSAGKP